MEGNFWRSSRSPPVTHHSLAPPIWSHCGCNSTTCHPVISVWAKESQTVLPVNQMTLAGANAATDMRVISGWMETDFTSCITQSLCSKLSWPLYPTERETYCWVITFSGGFSLNVFILWNENRVHSTVLSNLFEWKALSGRRNMQYWCTDIFSAKKKKKTFENGFQQRGMKVLWFTTACEPVSNSAVQPLPFLLILGVKLQHKACVAAPASAMNTNAACGHVLCNKSGKWINVRGEGLDGYRMETCQQDFM